MAFKKIFRKQQPPTQATTPVQKSPSATPAASVAATKAQAEKLVDQTHHVAERGGVLEHFSATFSHGAHAIAHHFGAKHEEKTPDPNSWEHKKAGIEQKFEAYRKEKKACEEILNNEDKEYDEKDSALQKRNGELNSLNKYVVKIQTSIPLDDKNAAERKYIVNQLRQIHLERIYLQHEWYCAAKSKDNLDPSLSNANTRKFKLDVLGTLVNHPTVDDDDFFNLEVSRYKAHYDREYLLTSAILAAALKDPRTPRAEIERSLYSQTQPASATGKMKKHYRQGEKERLLKSPVAERSDAVPADAEKASDCCTCSCWPFWKSKPQQAPASAASAHSSARPGMKYGSDDARS